MSEHQLLLFLVDVLILLLAARVGGEIADRLHLPHHVGELVFGMLLGPSFLGWVWPEAFAALFPAEPLQRSLLDVVSWTGVIFLAVITGLETRLGLLRDAGRAVFGSWIGGFGLPFVSGFALGMALPESLVPVTVDRPVFALFVATALSISAIPVIARILMDLRLTRTRVGTVILAAAMADDTVGWVTLSIVAGLVSGGVDGGSLAWVLALTIGFVTLAFTLGRPLVTSAMAFSRRLRLPYSELSMMFLVVLTAGAITQAIGVHLVLGAFVGAILVGRDTDLTEDSKRAVRAVGMGVFVPIFFAYTGAKVDLTSLRGSALVFTAIAVLVACLSKIVGGGLGARLGGLPTWEAIAVGFGLNARGAMELVIATIGISIGVLNASSYAMVVLIAVLTTVMTAPLLRWSMQRAGVLPLASGTDASPGT